MTSILGFLFCAALIFFTGRKLSYYGDVIAEKTGLGKAWVGLVLMASVTSLPELVSGISASAIVGSADLAVGNVMGACALNLGILALLDSLIPERKTLLGSASQSHVLAAALGIILFAMVGFGLVLERAVGNYLGSNIFNVFILAVDEIFYTKGYLIVDASGIHLYSVLSIIVMSAVVIIGLVYRTQKKRFLLAWDAVLIFLTYLFNLVLIYHFTS